MQKEQPWIFKTYDKPLKKQKFGLRRKVGKGFIHGSLKTEPSQPWRAERGARDHFHGSLKTEPSKKWSTRKKRKQQYRPKKLDKYINVTQSLDLSKTNFGKGKKKKGGGGKPASASRPKAPFKKSKKIY